MANELADAMLAAIDAYIATEPDPLVRQDLFRAVYNPLDFVMIVEDVKAYTVGGGTFTGGGDRIRDLNTVRYNSIAGASLFSNQITLPAGMYEVEWSAPGYLVQRHWTWLYDVTGAVILVLGSSEFAHNNAAIQSRSMGSARFTLGTESVIELRHRCVITSTTFGLGVNTSVIGFDSIYAQLKLRRIG